VNPVRAVIGIMILVQIAGRFNFGGLAFPGIAVRYPDISDMSEQIELAILAGAKPARHAL
jgi:hypothetical protein